MLLAVWVRASATAGTLLHDDGEQMDVFGFFFYCIWMAKSQKENRKENCDFKLGAVQGADLGTARVQELCNVLH